MGKYQFVLTSSLEKVFPQAEPNVMFRPYRLAGIKGEEISFCIAHRRRQEVWHEPSEMMQLHLHSDIKDSISISTVELVPSTYSGLDDGNYLSTAPGMFPDLLVPSPDGSFKMSGDFWNSLWISVKLSPELVAGVYPVLLQIKKDSLELWSEAVEIEIIDAVLPKQNLIHTEWFHADCLADYYNVEVFSNEHFDIIDNFIKKAADSGINMILTPVLSPPLDVQIGGERTTVQLVDVEVKGTNKYAFGFDKLRKWISICKKSGIEYYEMSHLFSQWGAKYAPKVIATENGQQRKIFGWHTPAVSDEYAGFLVQFLSELIPFLEQEGISEKTYFHISDEPSLEHLENYEKAKGIVAPLLKNHKIMDALSSFELYKQGAVDNPIPSNDHIQTFIDNGVQNLWTYYCVAQNDEVSNRFMSMPSARNRIIGVQMYLHNIKGFLHWGYNFYNSQYSLEKLDPFRVTDCNGIFPSGDAFLVYPGKGGQPLESIRLKVFAQALYDIRAFELLESLAGRKFVEDIIYEGVAEEITFKKYPKEDSYLLNLRKRVNEEIANFSVVCQD